MFVDFFSVECVNLLELLIAAAGLAEGFDDEDLVE
jgi:hypothetical protein